MLKNARFLRKKYKKSKNIRFKYNKKSKFVIPLNHQTNDNKFDIGDFLV